jgi:hypothetical protein
MLMTKEEIFEKISEWEEENGEDFLDYFSGSMNEYNFMFWCVGKGLISSKQFEFFERDWKSSPDYLVGDEKYSVIDAVEKEDYDKANMILAEFFSLSATYQKRLRNFLDNVHQVTWEKALKEFISLKVSVFYIKEGETERNYIQESTPLNLREMANARWFIDNND